MRIINLTGKEICLQNKRGEIFYIPSAQKFEFNAKIYMRDWNDFYANKIIETDGIEEPVSIKNIKFEFDELPPKLRNYIYVVDEATQFLIRSFTNREDFYTVFNKHLCCVKKSSIKHN